MEGRVLIVEDDPNVLQIAQDFLKYDGHEVLTAVNGKEGLEVFKANPFDVVVTDVKMPKMDGIEMMKAMKVIDPAIEVIVLTGYGTMEMTIDVIRSGGYDFLRKPDDLTQRIRPTVQRAIEKRRLWTRNQELIQELEQANVELGIQVRDLTALHDVTRILAEVSNVEEAAPRMLNALLNSFGWDLAALWRIDRIAGVMRCVALCESPASNLDNFATLHREMTFAQGRGVAGRVWKEGTYQPLTEDAWSETVSPGAGIEPGALHGMGFPIIMGEGVIGVIEFFHHEAFKQDNNLIELMTAIGRQLSVFIQREQLEKQFLQSQKMEAIGRLAGGIAHDFNNLLTSIIGYAQLIEKRLEPESALFKNAAQIQKTGHRAASLIQQLLTFSRRQVLKPVLLNLNEIIANLDKMLHRLLSDNIVMKTSLGKSLSPILADQTQIEQVILNLVVNARDAMPSGGVLTLETSDVALDEAEARLRELDPGVYVRLDVTDTGHGMDETVRAHIFEPFFTTKQQGQGSGLGLATVYGIVRQTHGYIDVTSAPGKGATFSIYLPVADKDAAPAPQEEKKAETPAETADYTGTETILLAEDDDKLRDMAKQCLEEAGYNVLEASNGIDALVRCEQHDAPVHLLLTDVVMPLMNGDVLAERIGRMRPGIKIVFMSGHADEALQRHRVFDTGYPFLPKPFSIDELLQRVRDVLDDKTDKQA